jgi:hypothetical protein
MGYTSAVEYLDPQTNAIDPLGGKAGHFMLTKTSHDVPIFNPLWRLLGHSKLTVTAAGVARIE